WNSITSFRLAYVNVVSVLPQGVAENSGQPASLTNIGSVVIMKILLGHNFYRSSAPSGENTVFANEQAILSRHGHEVVLFERFNDEIDDSSLASRLKVARDGSWSPTVYRELSTIVQDVKPDIAHFHNTFPMISPSAYAACRENGVPVVQTLHNFRLICPGGLLLREGHPCEDCVGTNLLPALKHRCYRGSLLATGAVVLMLERNRWNGTYNRLVNRYIALTQFAASRLVQGGLPSERIVIKPNCIVDAPGPGNGGGGYVAYVGRLSEEKGVRTLIAAWRALKDIPLKILGEGPLRVELEKVVAREELPVEFMGYCTRETATRVVSSAAFQLVPSEWYEGFPMVIVEGYACGTPIIASRIGSLNEIVEDGQTGMKFTPGDVQDLIKKVRMVWSNPGLQLTMRRIARQRFDERFSDERNYESLMAIYQSVHGER
ncbi:MAG: glycosyltransferase family 4 protein, partial [Nitrospira sp.]|nr:glycosyltransferase family 4 protein [Nitrospira sp.]